MERLPALTEAVWQEIVKAAAPMRPDDQARASIRECIENYYNLAVDIRRAKLARDRWRKRAAWARKLADRRPPWRKIELRAIGHLQRRAERRIEGFDVLVSAHQGGRDPEGGWLWGQLFEVWEKRFGGKVKVSVRRGVPTGPLVRFVVAIFEHLLNQSISPHTIQAAVRRENRRRRKWQEACARRESFKGIFDRKK